MLGKYKRLSAAILLAMGVQAAQAEYLRDSSGEIVQNDYGTCWHMGYWDPQDAVPGCDGVTTARPEVVAVETVALVPVVPKVKTLDKIVLDADTYFGFDKAELREAASEKLDLLVETIRASDGLESITITGYADPIGSPDYNKDLSKRRADNVASYIANRIGDAKGLQTHGMGEANPVVTCEGEKGSALISCLAPNRRVEIEAKVRVIEP